MSSGLDKAVAPAVGAFISLAIAFVVIAAISTVAAYAFGGNNRQNRKAIFSIVSGVCFLIYLLVFLPRILGGHG